ncbi:hypothetical protein [Streptacidiphilus sp. EB129]|uniref:hypothetical protein n=1 Tax=Streptacidiphilus sp. EB129 TaxID=3156262 RepID=UPI0035182BBF
MFRRTPPPATPEGSTPEPSTPVLPLRTGRSRATSRALRTALAAGVLLAATAGVLLSGDHQAPLSASATGPSATPSIAVDPLTGPVGIDPTGPAGSGGSGTAGSASGPSGSGSGSGIRTPAAMAALPGHPMLVSDAAAGSAVTVHGGPAFPNLTVTVAQTTNLVDQVVPVTWTGGTPTTPNPSTFGQNFMELMECWGDAPTGPDRTQCQYGASVGDSRGGAYIGSRQLNYGSLVDTKDPAPATKPGVNVYVPFDSVRGTVDTGSSSKSFDASSTNEVPFAPTRADGTGQVFFETETAEEAQGLGCGAVPDSVKGVPKEGRQCWLVIVPRGNKEVDGTVPTANSGMLQSSPLSASNWASRLVVPLHYSPQGVNCPIGDTDLHTYGTEMAEEAMLRWSPVMCRQTTTNFRYTKIDDNLAREKMNTGTDPGLVFVSDPQPPSAVAPGRTPVYAPLALSGVTIGFDIESQSNSLTPPDKRSRDGQRITTLNLTPRLVAKLLTQTYRYAVDYRDYNDPNDPTNPNNPSVQKVDDHIADNPLDLTSDPDFLALNPDFAGLSFPSRIPDMIVPLGQSDAARHLWAWVEADPDARAFLNGQKDAAQVNAYYTTPGVMTLPRDDFPKSDPYCKFLPTDLHGNVPQLCTLDAHPYANDMHDAARSASRGDTLARTVWDPTATPPQLTKGAAQAQGLRGILTVTDTATAARYGLNTASLYNGSGRFVAPTTASLLAGEAAMTTFPGTTVRTLQPTAKGDGVYPLTMLTYAATAPAQLPRIEATSYASMIGYAMGAGQVVGYDNGMLSPGYVPLPQNLRTEALSAAKAMVSGSYLPSATPRPGHTGGSGSTTTHSGGTAGGTGTSSGSGAGSGSGSGPGSGSGAGAAASPAHQVVTVNPESPAPVDVARTAATPVGVAHWLLAVLLGAGALAALLGTVLPPLLRRRPPA